MNVFYLSMNPEVPASDYWNYTFLKDFIAGSVWKPDGFPEFNVKECATLDKSEQAIVAIPGEYQADYINQINTELAKIKHVVLFIMSDEEGKFPVELINHPSIHIWVMAPVPGRHDEYNRMLTGYPPKLRQIVKNLSPEKTKVLFFSGQVTHKRRTEMMKHLPENNPDYDINRTSGFTKGFGHQEYYERTVKAKIVPNPAGAYSPDCFRLVEAFECMCVPIADEKDAHGFIDGYWEWFFKEQLPFPLIKDWNNLPGYIEDVLNNWPDIMHQQTAWWINYKRDFAYKVLEQLND